MWRLWLLLPAILVLGASNLPPIPSAPTIIRKSPKAAETFVGKTTLAAIALPPPPDPILAWDYPSDPPNWMTDIAFDIWHVQDVYQTNTYWATNLDTGNAMQLTNVLCFLTNWIPYTMVTGVLTCPVVVTQRADFFKIRAVDINTGVPSDWAHN